MRVSYRGIFRTLAGHRHGKRSRKYGVCVLDVFERQQITRIECFVDFLATLFSEMLVFAVSQKQHRQSEIIVIIFECVVIAYSYILTHELCLFTLVETAVHKQINFFSALCFCKQFHDLLAFERLHDIHGIQHAGYALSNLIVYINRAFSAYVNKRDYVFAGAILGYFTVEFEPSAIELLSPYGTFSDRHKSCLVQILLAYRFFTERTLATQFTDHLVDSVANLQKS